MQVCTSLQTDNHASTPPLSFLQGRCPSCHPTNSVKALKAEHSIQCQINANRGPWWQLFARAPLLTRDKDLSQPATRVNTTCWQLFRPAINTDHFYLLLQMLCQITRLLMEAPLWPEARGICHICHMVNPALTVYRHSSSQSNLPPRNSHATWDHTVLPATRQR